ncbi:LysR family transcriptional regulator [Cupriavidus sp. 2TAF22]|uniref:LysR family transcriptional regulator n=1 Tax=unclassified Cupriavidus TaxID=2640874 RepID=UPI003F8F8128
MNKNLVPDLSSRELQAVCAIADEGSLLAASIALDLSQPALTRTLQRVEAAIGVELFRRSTRKVEITAAGLEFVALANRILADLRISFEGMREIADEQRGQVIISAVMSVASTHLPIVVARYRESRPRIEIQVREGVHGTVLDNIRSGVADLGLTYVDDVPAEFSAIALGREGFHVVMPANHPLAGRKTLTLVEVANYAMVSLPKEAQTRRMLDGAAAAAGLNLQHAVTVTQFATVMQFVHAGVGLAIVPGGAIPAALGPGLVLKPLAQPVLTRHIGVIVLKDRGLTPSAEGFLAELKEHWKARPPARRGA